MACLIGLLFDLIRLFLYAAYRISYTSRGATCRDCSRLVILLSRPTGPEEALCNNKRPLWTRKNPCLGKTSVYPRTGIKQMEAAVTRERSQ